MTDVDKPQGGTHAAHIQRQEDKTEKSDGEPHSARDIESGTSGHAPKPRALLWLGATAALALVLALALFGKHRYDRACAVSAQNKIAANQLNVEDTDCSCDSITLPADDKREDSSFEFGDTQGSGTHNQKDTDITQQVDTPPFDAIFNDSIFTSSHGDTDLTHPQTPDGTVDGATHTGSNSFFQSPDTAHSELSELSETTPFVSPAGHRDTGSRDTGSLQWQAPATGDGLNLDTVLTELPTDSSAPPDILADTRTFNDIKEELLAQIFKWKSINTFAENSKNIYEHKAIKITKHIFTMSNIDNGRECTQAFNQYEIRPLKNGSNEWLNIDDVKRDLGSEFEIARAYYAFSFVEPYLECTDVDFLLPIKINPLYFVTSNNYIKLLHFNQKHANLRSFASFYNIKNITFARKDSSVTFMFTSDLHHTLANIFGKAAIVDNGELVVTGNSLHKAFPMWFPDVDMYFGRCTALHFQKMANTLLLTAWYDVVVINKTCSFYPSAKAAMHLMLLYNMTMNDTTFSLDFLNSKHSGHNLSSFAKFSDIYKHRHYTGIPLIPSTKIELLPDYVEPLL